MYVPQNEPALLERCQTMEGWTFAQLASKLYLTIPLLPTQRKGWLGQAIELYLGATARNQSIPDFAHLGIELKTLPLGKLGTPSESTFVSRIPLLTLQQQVFENSDCYHKLRKVLWIPIEGDTTIPYPYRRIGKAILWSSSAEDTEILKQDWQHFALLISTGRWADIDARMGEYLQVRPKAANSHALCEAYDEQGNIVLTMPRGFYLRSLFTRKIMINNGAFALPLSRR